MMLFPNTQELLNDCLSVANVIGLNLVKNCNGKSSFLSNMGWGDKMKKGLAVTALGPAHRKGENETQEHFWETESVTLININKCKSQAPAASPEQEDL